MRRKKNPPPTKTAISEKFLNILLTSPKFRATPTLEEWTAVIAEEVEKLISSTLNITCELDSARIRGW